MLKLNKITKTLVLLFALATPQVHPLSESSARICSFGVGIATFFGALFFTSFKSKPEQTYFKKSSTNVTGVQSVLTGSLGIFGKLSIFLYNDSVLEKTKRT